MRSCTESAWQRAWHNRCPQQTVDAFNIPHWLLSPNTTVLLFEGQSESLRASTGPTSRFPEAEESSQWGLALFFTTTPSRLEKGPLPPRSEQRLWELQRASPGSAISKFCAAGPQFPQLQNSNLPVRYLTGSYVGHAWNQVCKTRADAKGLHGWQKRDLSATKDTNVYLW